MSLRTMSRGYFVFLPWVVACSIGFVCSLSTNGLARENRLLRSVEVVRRQSLSQGWDNENYLESLGQGQDAVEDANAEYWKHNEQNEKLNEWRAEMQARQKEAEEARQENVAGQEGAYAASPDMIANLDKLQSMAASNEDNPTGGTKFQQMMQRAKMKQQQRTQPPPPPSQQAQQQPMQLYDQHGNPVQYFDKDGNPVTLYPPQPAQPAQPAQPQHQQYSSPPSDQRVTRNDHRRVGRNHDADAISNTADVYFAQLKRDSTIRTTARIAGDVETANKPLDHPDIDKMKDKIHKNPYLEAEMAKQKTMAEERKKIMSFLETSEDEMVDWSETAPTTADKQQTSQQEEDHQANMGNYQSFKDKLRAAQAKRNNGNGGTF